MSIECNGDYKEICKIDKQEKGNISSKNTNVSKRQNKEIKTQVKQGGNSKKETDNKPY